MDEIVVGVTGINASDNPMPGIGVARSLKEDKGLNLRVAGLAYDALEPGIYMDRVIDRSFLIPYPSAGSGRQMARLLSIKESFGLDVVLPTLDSELPFFIRYRDELARRGIQTFLPDSTQFRLCAKRGLGEIAERCGVSVPRQQVVDAYQGLDEAVREIGLPVMVKGARYKAWRADTLAEAHGHFAKMVAQWGYPVIIQQVVGGVEMNVIGVGDGAGRLMGRMAIKKMTVTELGKIWTGVTIRHPGLLETTRRFIASTSWRGAFELEFMADPGAGDGGKVYLIEINPRFPAWVYFATGAGVNLPAMLLRSALGEAVTVTEYESGKLYIRYTDEQVCDMARFQALVTKGEA
uniref:Carbamoyl-phosphate synthase large subunit n=1 Tax=Candidatus Kentrum sp. FW TaxID=2126338 RepID=A0A450SVQ6_9GAMM|nr:MAG: carbamoyl-phosphate synthase large subunit [Candidatus Kentron sp. FW]